MILDDLSRYMAGDLSGEEKRVLAHAGTRILWRCALVIFIAFAMGWFGFMGVPGFARADQVDQKIAKQVAPLTSQVSNLTQAVKIATDAQTEQTLALLRVAITDGLVKKCHAAKDETKSIYRQQVAEAQARYYRLTGNYYPEHSCADL
jgi:hypothetical protein